MHIIRYLQNLSDEQKVQIDRYFIRISAISLILATMLWYLYQILVNMHIVGYTDFRNIYTGAYAGLHGDRTLYILSTQFHIQHHFFSILTTKQAYILPFLTPPFMAIFLSPLAVFSPSISYVIWGICNLLFLLLIIVFIKNTFISIRWQFQYLIIGMLLTFVPIWEALLQGQLSFLLLLSVFFGWYLMTHKRDFWAGFVLSLLAIKPHFIFILILCLLIKRRKAFGGLVVGLLLLGCISFTFIGVQGMVEYAHLLLSISGWGEMYGMHPKLENTWGGLLNAYVNTNYLSQVFVPWISGIFIALIVFIVTLVKRNVFDLQWAFLITLIVFVGPHVFFHDVSLLAVAAIAICHYVMEHKLSVLKKRLLLLIPLVLYFGTFIDFAFQMVHIWLHPIVWFEIGSMIVLTYVMPSSRVIPQQIDI